MSRSRAEQVLSDSLRLQRSAVRAQLAPRGRGRRRKGAVIDLDQRTFHRPRRRRLLMALLIAEAVVAAVAVVVLIVYLATTDGALR